MTRSRSGKGHPHIDQRSLEMARIVVERIDADPSLVGIACENLERWRRHQGEPGLADREWSAILNRPGAEIREILVDDPEEGQRLRSSHPFRGIVSEEERRAIVSRNRVP